MNTNLSSPFRAEDWRLYNKKIKKRRGEKLLAGITSETLSDAIKTRSVMEILKPQSLGDNFFPFSVVYVFFPPTLKPHRTKPFPLMPKRIIFTIYIRLEMLISHFIYIFRKYRSDYTSYTHTQHDTYISSSAPTTAAIHHPPRSQSSVVYFRDSHQPSCHDSG